MKLYYSSPVPHVVKHLGKVVTHVVEHKAANKLVDKAVSSSKSLASPKPSATAKATKSATKGLQWNIHTPFQFFWHFPWVLPILIIGAGVGLHYGWKKIELKYNISGSPLAPWRDYVKRIRGIMYHEDKTQVFVKQAFLLRKFPNFIWQKYWRIFTTAVILELLVLFFYPNIVAYAFLLPLFLVGLFGSGHIKEVFSIRMRTIMQMFEVADSVMRYPPGAKLNPWGYIQISSWGDPENPDSTPQANLYYPGPTYVMYPPKFQSEERGPRESFERNFNGTVSDENTWIYEWESSNNRVLCKPVPFIPEKTVQYPFPDKSPWNIFPLGEASGGKEAFFDVSKFPHLLIAGTTGSGKALDIRYSIPTPSGWTTMGEITIGDYVFDENGNPTKVIGVSEINNNADLYRVKFSDGSFVDADAEHLWRTETRRSLESRWNTNRKVVERRSLITEKGIANLKLLRDSLSEKDELTMEQIMSTAGIPNSTWLIKVSKEVGHVGEIQIKIQQHYKAQTVKQNQKVTRYPAKEVWAALSGHEGKGYGFIKSRKEVFISKLNSVSNGDTVSVVDIVKLGGFPTNASVHQFLGKHKVTGIIKREIVELVVPERTSEKLSKPIKSYNAYAIIDAILNRVETPANDQRYKKVYSQVRTTKEILETLKHGALETHLNHSIEVAKPLNLPEVDLPISPYLLGVWLGDGFSRQGAFCGIDQEIADHIGTDGYKVEARIPKGGSGKKENPAFRIWTVLGLKAILAEEKLLQRNTLEGTKKHIPAIYLRSSIEQRKALLAGLLDTDGTADGNGGAEFVNTNPHIAFGAYELAISLGYRATISEGRAKLNGVDHGPKWTVSFTCAESPFRLSRKTKVFNERSKNYNPQLTERRYITAVEKIPNAPARCIMVEAQSKMFLAGREMIPTHNSVTQRTLLMHVLQSPEWRIALVDPKRVELAAYRNHKHVVAVATELEESVELIENVEKEMQGRYLKMQNEQVNFFKNLKTPPPALLLMVDETYALLAPEKIKSDEGKARDDMHARITLLIGSIARLGRAAGVHMILATQRPDAAVIPGETKANLDARIAQGRMDSIPSNMTLDSDRATRIPNIKGRAVLRTGNDFTEFQAYFLPEEQLSLVMEMSEALATGQIDLSVFESNEPEPEPEDGGRFAWLRKIPKPSIKLPSLPEGISLRLSDFMERRRAVAEANDARSHAAIEAAKNAATGGKPSGRGKEKGSGRKGSRGAVEPVFDPSEEEDELDIDAIANEARARGIDGGRGNLDLKSNDSEHPERRRRGFHRDPEALIEDDDESLELHSFETDDRDVDEHDFEDALENEAPVRSRRAFSKSSRDSVEDDSLEDQNISKELDDEQEPTIDEALAEMSKLEGGVPLPEGFPGFDTVDSVDSAPLTFDLNKLRPITIEQVLAKADELGTPISSAELLAALQYEAALEAAGMPIPTVHVPVLKEPLDPIQNFDKDGSEREYSPSLEENEPVKSFGPQGTIEDSVTEGLPFAIPMPDVVSVEELKDTIDEDEESFEAEGSESEADSEVAQDLPFAIPMPGNVLQSSVPGIFGTTFIPQIPARQKSSEESTSLETRVTPLVKIPVQKALSAESAAEQQWISLPVPSSESQEAPWMPKEIPSSDNAGSPFGGI